MADKGMVNGRSPFFLIWLSIVITQIGSSVQLTALNWEVLERTNSAFLIGLIATSTTLPQFLFSFTGGTLADKYPKLKTLRVILLLQLCVALGLSLFIKSNNNTFFILYFLSFALGVLNAIWQPVYLSYIPKICPTEFISTAMGLSLIGLYLSRSVGPFIASYLIENLPNWTPFLLYSISFIIPVFVFSIVKLPHADSRKSKVSEMNLKSTFELISQDDVLLPLWLLTAVLSLFIMPIFSIVSVYAKNVFNMDSSGLSLLMGACGIGQLIGAIITTMGGKKNNRQFGKQQIFGYLLIGILLLFFSLSNNLVLSVSTLLLFNVLHGILSPRVNTIVQTYANASEKGKIQSLFLWVFGLVPLGQFTLGTITNTEYPQAGSFVFVMLYLGAVVAILLHKKSGIKNLILTKGIAKKMNTNESKND